MSAETKEPEKCVVAYQGRFIVNSRDIQEVTRIAALRREPTQRELNVFLSFLDIFVLASALRYDDDIPSKYREPFEEAINLIGPGRFKPLKRIPDGEIRTITCESLEAANEEVKRILCPPMPHAQPVKDSQDITNFYKILGDMNGTSMKGRSDLAMEKYHADFHGKKLVIALSGERNEDLLHQICRQARTKGHTYKAVLMSALIDAFRTEFLARRGGMEGAILATEPRRLAAFTRQRAWIWRKFSEMLRAKYIGLQPRGGATWSFPLLSGALLGEVPKQKRAQDLFEYATEFSATFSVPAIQTKMARMAMNGEDEANIQQAANELYRQIGYRRPEPRFWKRILSELLPFLPAVGGFAATLAAIAARATDLEKALAALGGASVPRAVFLLANEVRKRRDFVGAMRNLVEYNITR
jgi:hypothetical protein